MAKGWTPNKAGLSRFKRNVLNALPEEAAQGIEDAHRQNGREIVRVIRADAPFDEGEIEASVGWSFGDPPPGVMGAGDKSHAGIPERLRMSIYAGGKKAPHAHLVHNGTQSRQTEDGANRGMVSPQPFFWPNIRAFRKRMRARISRKAREAIKRAAR